MPIRPAMQKPGKYTWIMLLGILVLLGLVMIFLFKKPTPDANTVSINNDHSRSYGSVNAPVKIVEYGDFGCTTCQAWYRQAIMEQILLEYGNQVSFEWRDFPVITAQSPKAAEAGLCASDQGRFWDYHNLVYIGNLAISTSDLKETAKSVGLNLGTFNQCLDSGKYKAEVDQELRDGNSLGFIGTPAFTVNSHKIIGPASLSEFKSLIDSLLPKSQ